MRRVLTGLSATMLFALALAPPASAASVGLAPGMEIRTQTHTCTLGFFATNSAGKRLAVTAGHCANAPGERVYSHNRNLIGEVVSQHGDTDGPASGLGVAVIQLARSAYVADGFFATFSNPVVGDYVRKYGERSEGTYGQITDVVIDTDYPRRSIMHGTLIALPGDSGSPWYGPGPTLYGITVGGFSQRSDNAYKGAYGFPIGALIQYVRGGSEVWGPGFTPVGR
jgi:hypothetical protein